MYELRAAIRYRQSVAEGNARVEKNLGKISESLLHQALLASDPDDGQNLMAYAARWGREEWFIYLIQHIRDQVRHCNSVEVCAPAREMPMLLLKELDLWFDVT